MANHFSDTFRCFSSVFFGVSNLDHSGRIVLPEQVLNEIIQRFEATTSEVMIFEIRNNRLGISVYAGVKDFTMTPGQVCAPRWIMEYLQINDGDPVMISLTNLPKATRALFQPLDSAFFKITNQRVVLEHNLRSYPCLTQGTILPIDFNNVVYKLKVLKTEPKNAVLTLKADVICDFAQAADKFDHHWNEPDTDSSDEEGNIKIRTGRTLGGRQVNDKPKPLHSTLAQREYDRMHGNVFRTREIVAGQEILPPKPREKMAKKGKKDVFAGTGHFIKKAKKKDQKMPEKEEKKNATPPPQPINQPNPAPKSIHFAGVGRTMGGNTISPPPPQSKSQPQLQKEDIKTDEEPKKTFFGAGRTLKGVPTANSQDAISQFANNNNTNNSTTNSSGSSFFKGQGRSLK